jgi:hypothetical protein
MNAGKIWLPPEGAQAVREVLDKANVAQSDRYPAEDYAKSLFADTPPSLSTESGIYDTQRIHTALLCTT